MDNTNKYYHFAITSISSSMSLFVEVSIRTIKCEHTGEETQKKITTINQKTGVYRRNEGGVSFRMNLSKAKLLIKQYQFMIQYFAEYPDLVEYSKYFVQVHCWYIMYESEASIWVKLKYLRLERSIINASVFTRSTISYCLNTIRKSIFYRK